eukprot:2353059-Amphidinium_carterae.2
MLFLGESTPPEVNICRSLVVRRVMGGGVATGLGNKLEGDVTSAKELALDQDVLLAASIRHSCGNPLLKLGRQRQRTHRPCQLQGSS